MDFCFGATRLLILLSSICIWVSPLMFTSSLAQSLPPQEVETLKAISSKLKIPRWNLNPQSCNAPSGFNFTNLDDFGLSIYSRVACDCSFNASTVCHVTSIQLKGLNLTGNLPEEFLNLPQLTEIDLSRNFLNGSIPRAFGRLRITTLSLLGNNLTGPIPDEIGNIATLEDLVLDNNQLEGNLPASLGRLRNLRRLLLSANNFNGTIPATFGDLRNLTDFRIDGSTISGRIPSFIGNWTQLDRLDMQGMSMEGPVPESIALLVNLTSLRISDLAGSSIPFPNLQPLTNLEELILRNCSITGTFPLYIGDDLRQIKTLDLSYNKLNGTIPANLLSLKRLNFLFLSQNSLTGDIPNGILTSRQNIARDLSYNNFTGSSWGDCGTSDINLLASHSSSASNSIAWCLKRDLPCASSTRYHSLYVNCGGWKTEFDGIEYEENLNTEGPSHYQYYSKWAYSSTGVYMGNERAQYIARNDSSMISTNADIYQTARLSPHSIKFYGLCMRSGSYTVRLHFAEIVFYDNATYNGLGRRLFDIAIQGVVREADFNIAREANGVRRGIFRDYQVNVTGTTLEIHLYWRGKGTTSVPARGAYGPLISAIAITPNFDVSTGGLSAGAIVGIVIASVVLAILILLAVLWKIGCLGGKDVEDKELRALDLQTGHFTLRQMKAATGNFDNVNKIGEGGFGPVYKGVLSDGTIIAVKQLSAKSKQGNREFVNEIGMISALQHPNLVRLYGCCIEGNQLLLIYEYLENNSLARALFGRVDQRLALNWATRKKICLQIAKGLAYLHEESRLKIVHRDIKATNVLLDKDLNAKISDFGLAKLDEDENTHISTRIAGTIGYMAPEYAMRGYLTDKADVYSFGIVLLEVVSGKSNTNYRPKEEFVYLLDWAYVLQEQGNLLELVDESLGSNFSKEEAKRMLNLALLCANPSPTLRPSMSAAVSMLEGKIPVQAPIIKRGAGEDMRFKAFELLSHDSQTNGPWIDSSATLSSKEDDSRDETSSSNKLLPNV